MAMNDGNKALTCKLTNPELQKRRTTVIRDLKALVLTRQKLDLGLQFTFPGNDEVLDQLISFIKSERGCCDFLSFRLSLTGERAVLELTGPEGTPEFLEQEIGF
jgi:hypothetical protein